MGRLWMDAFYTLVIAVLGALLAAAGLVLQARESAARDVVTAARDDVWAYERAFALAAVATGIAVIVWWLAAFALALLVGTLRIRGAGKSAAWVARLCPGSMRRLAMALLSVQLVALPALNSGAASSFAAVSVPATVSLPAAVWAPAAGPTATGLAPRQRGAASPVFARPPEPEPISPAWKPRPTPPGAGALIRRPRPAEPDADEDHSSVVVRPGDTLWTIAAQRLGGYATDVEIALSWPEWYAQNRTLIGSDPSLIQPGQILQAPAPHG